MDKNHRPKNKDNLNLGEKLNKLMDSEEEPFETLDIEEVAMNNDNNPFRKMITSLTNKGNVILQKIK